MTKKLLLHIGTEKTGTTSIQTALAVNRQRLRAEGVLFPRSLGPVNHTLLAANCLDDDVTDNIKGHILAKRSRGLKRFRQKLVTEFKDEASTGVPWHSLIVSTELIHSRLTQPSEIKRLFEFFEPFVDDVEVVVALRRQDDLAVSRFSSVLRAGHSGFDDVFADIGEHVYLSKPPSRDVRDFANYFDYQNLIQRFADHVPVEKITVRLYDEVRKTDGAVADFLSIAGIMPGQLVESADRLNPAMSAQGQFVLSALNAERKPWFASGLRDEAFKKLQIEVERTVTGERRQVARDDARRFFDQFAASNEWVRATFFPDRAELFDQDFSRYPDAVDYSAFATELAPMIESFAVRAAALPKAPPTHVHAISARIQKRRQRRKIKRHNVPSTPRGAALQRKMIAPIHLVRKALRSKSALETKETVPFEIALVRILGADHVPRHSSRQTLDSLTFILENEPDFPGCTKFFVVNRIFDTDAEKEILDLLDSRGIEYVRLPFVGADYAKADWDTEPFGGDAYFKSKMFSALKERALEQARVFAATPKILYAMNVNGARNAALLRGRELAQWTLPLDGNCILNAQSYDLIRKTARSWPHVPYMVVPMKRLGGNEEYFQMTGAEPAAEEPQLGFHRTASEMFDVGLPYGVRDKAEVLVRLGVPGPWMKWKTPFWVPQKRDRSPDWLQFKKTRGTVFRLAAGMKVIGQKEVHSERFLTRNTSILRTLCFLDNQFGCRNEDAEIRIFGSQIDTFGGEP